MNIQDKIVRLESELQALKEQQSNCRHDWTKPKQVQVPVREYLYKNVAHGSDIYPEICGSHSVNKTVWQRSCTIYGLKQETDKTEPIIVGRGPVF